MPIVPPGQRKFKLKKLDEPIKTKEGYTYTHVCPELADSPCPSCHQGAIYVAYGFEDGKYSVYRFPCKCMFPQGGKDWWELDNPELYRDRPVDYFATPAELPGHVFIHPSHKRGFEKLLKRVRMVIARQKAEQGEDLPF